MPDFQFCDLTDREQTDFKADGRLRAYFALKSAFKKRAEENGVTIKSLAKCLGRDKAQISKVLAGRSGVNLDTLVLLTSALGFRLEFVPRAVETMRATNWSAAPHAPIQPVKTSSAKLYIFGESAPQTSRANVSAPGDLSK